VTGVQTCALPIFS